MEVVLSLIIMEKTGILEPFGSQEYRLSMFGIVLVEFSVFGLRIPSSPSLFQPACLLTKMVRRSMFRSNHGKAISSPLPIPVTSSRQNIARTPCFSDCLKARPALIGCSVFAEKEITVHCEFSGRQTQHKHFVGDWEIVSDGITFGVALIPH